MAKDIDSFLVLARMKNGHLLAEDYKTMVNYSTHIRLVTTIRQLARDKEKGLRGIIGYPTTRDDSSRRCYAFDIYNNRIVYVGLLKC